MRFKTEVSAGGVVYRRFKNSIQVLLLRDSKGNWTFPKGLVENDEDFIKTAEREIKEETGLDKIIYKADLETVKYIYTFKDTLIKKTVHYFLFEVKDQIKLKPQKEEGITEAKFVKLEQAKKIIGYQKTNALVLRKVEDFFQKNNV